MDLNTSSDVSQFSGFSESDIPADFHDKNNGVLYVVKESCLGESITISFYDKAVFEQVYERLTNIYLFTLNQPQTGHMTTTTIGKEKVVITAFKTGKLLIQGNESKLWKNTMFRATIENLSGKIPFTKNDKAGSEPDQTTSTPNPLLRNPGSKSKSTSFLGSVSKAIFGPSLNNDIVKLGKKLKKAEKLAKKGGSQVNYAEFQQQLKQIQESAGIQGKNPNQRKRGKSPVNAMNNKNSQNVQIEDADENINSNTKMSVRLSLHSPSIIKCGASTKHTDVISEPDNDSVTVPKSLYNDDCFGSTSTINSVQAPACHTSNEPKQTQLVQVGILQAEIDTLREDKRKLQAQNENLTKKIAKLLEMNKSLNQALTTQTQEANSTKQSIDSLNKKIKICDGNLTKLTSEALSLEEENQKLKATNRSLTAENKKLQTKLSQKEVSSEANQTLLSNIESLSEEVNNMKNALNKIQSKVENSATEAGIQLMKLDLKNSLKEDLKLVLKQELATRN